MLSVGEHAPWFTCRSTNNDNFSFSTVGGIYTVIGFFGTLSKPGSQKMLDAILRHAQKFDDKNMCFFGVSFDPVDEQLSRLKQRLPGIRYFWDFDNKVAKLFRVLNGEAYYPIAYILDPTLRVIQAIPLQSSADFHKRFDAAISELPALSQLYAAEGHAPVAIVPRVFEPDFCRELIALYNKHGGKDSGFMYESDGKTHGKIDYKNKRREDFTIEDEAVKTRIKEKIGTRLLPAIEKSFQFKVTRIERFLVAHYDGDVGGFFFAHRDNTTKGTAHRKFAVTINLNAEEFTGGELKFPEFGPKTYRAPTGGAVVFSCSLLHEALPVTSGHRYAFLPFLYNQEGEKIKQENAKYLTNV